MVLKTGSSPFEIRGAGPQAAMAKAINKSVRQIRRWETEATSADVIPFGRIAAALEFLEQELVTAHCAWIRACAISGIDVNGGRIARALQACACTTLTDDILRNLGVENLDTAACRRRTQNLPRELFNRRCNVEATIFQLCYHTNKKKLKYRGKFRVQLWAVCRGAWINMKRIASFQAKQAEVIA